MAPASPDQFSCPARACSLGRMGGELESARGDLQAAQRDRDDLVQELEALEEKAEEDMARARTEWTKEEKRMSAEAARLRDKVRDAEAEAERWKKMLAKVETQTHTLEDGGERLPALHRTALTRVRSAGEAKDQSLHAVRCACSAECAAAATSARRAGEAGGGCPAAPCCGTRGHRVQARGGRGRAGEPGGSAGSGGSTRRRCGGHAAGLHHKRKGAVLASESAEAPLRFT